MLDQQSRMSEKLFLGNTEKVFDVTSLGEEHSKCEAGKAYPNVCPVRKALAARNNSTMFRVRCETPEECIKCEE